MQLTVNIQKWVDTGFEPTALDIDAGGIVVGNDTNSLDSSQLVVNVADGSSVDISVSQDGYYTYETTINNVYKEDKEIFILLVENITDITDEEYLMPHAYFFYFRDPCSFKVDFYSASSYTGDISWYLNNECIYKDSNVTYFTYDFDSVGNFQMKMAVETKLYVNNNTPCGSGSLETAWLRQWANGDAYSGVGAQGETGNVIISESVSEQDLFSYLETDTQTNINVTEYRPTFTLNVSDPTDEIDETVCYTQYEDVTVTANVTLNRAGSDINNATVKFEVTDPSGLPIIQQEQPLALPLNQITFNAQELGTYNVKATVVDLGCPSSSWVREVSVETCNFVYLETTGECNNYTLYNMSSDKNISYNIELVGGEGDSPVEGTLNFDNSGASSVEISLVDAGIHTATIQWYEDENDPTSLKQQVLILNNWCELWDCLAGYINEVLCNPEELCNPCPDSLVLNEMLLFNQAYSMLMNEEYEFNNYYSALNDTQLAKYQTMNSVYKKIKKFCDRLSCSSPCVTVTQKDNTFKWGLKGKKSSKSKGCSSC